jgi:hypothetical protein
MQECTGWAAAPLATASIWRGLPPNCHGFSAASFFCTAKCSEQKSFMAHDQALAAAIPAAHDRNSEYHLAVMKPASTAARYLLILLLINKGGTAVILTLRFEVLAVCAVFVFVGAVLLGAF